MARSPILHLLRRSFAAARRASCTGEPILEVLQRADEARAAHRLSRREFLAAGAMAGGAAALSGCASLPRVQRRAQPDVLIVGAGLAGLTAAYRLTRAGIPARIIEAQDRVGGRCFSLRGHFLDDQVAVLREVANQFNQPERLWFRCGERLLAIWFLSRASGLERG